MGPGVGAVIGDEDGDVADDADTLAVGIGLQLQPLLIEQELLKLLLLNGIVQRGGPLFHGPLLPLGDIAGPLVPDAALLLLVVLLQGHEQSEVVEPVGGVGAEGVEGGALVGVAVGLEVFVGGAEQRALILDDRAEVDLGRGQRGRGLDRFGR